jgi:alkylation response protein AidB-like acyl-CoA dehydrogenase
MTAQNGYYQPPLDDIQFVIERWLQAPADWQRLPVFENLDGETASLVNQAAGQFCAEVLAPLNAPGDRQGCRLENGRVHTPDGFAAAYAAYAEAAWPALALPVAVGGQGLPQLLDAVLNEMVVSANHAWAMGTGILHGACACLHAHGSAALRQSYLPQLVSGRWLATMCLTEPQAGSDLGLLRTQARPQDDGSYRLDGNKIFISGGDQDWTENIVHLVLARLPDAPAGSKGLSLFLVPARLAQADGSWLPNAVACDGLEHKMGIKGSPTCALRFEGAQGWLIGQPHQGLAAMFVMMNSARLHVGLQGLAHAESAWQLARVYAKERRQMRQQPRPAGAPAAADPIAGHPAIRRILLDLRVWTEGMRALGYWAGHLLDLAEHEPQAEARSRAHALVSLLTPVIKSFFSERGFQLASEALQVFGGYGYTQDYRIEQTLRDARVAMIYEGTNQIQAIDLLQRKVLGDGQGLALLLQAWRAEAEACSAEGLQQPFGASLASWSERLQTLTEQLRRSAEQDAGRVARSAEDYLRLLGTLCLAYVWARAARVSPADHDPLHKRQSAHYVFAHGLLDAEHWLRRVEACEQPWADVGCD